MRGRTRAGDIPYLLGFTLSVDCGPLPIFMAIEGPDDSGSIPPAGPEKGAPDVQPPRESADRVSRLFAPNLNLSVTTEGGDVVIEFDDVPDAEAFVVQAFCDPGTIMELHDSRKNTADGLSNGRICFRGRRPHGMYGCQVLFLSGGIVTKSAQISLEGSLLGS